MLKFVTLAAVVIGTAAILLQQRKLIGTTAVALDKLNAILGTVGTVSTQLTDVGATLTKSFAEIQAEIAALPTGTSPEIDAAIDSITTKVAALQPVADALSATAKALDDLNPDPVPPAPPPAPDTPPA